MCKSNVFSRLTKIVGSEKSNFGAFILFGTVKKTNMTGRGKPKGTVNKSRSASLTGNRKVYCVFCNTAIVQSTPARSCDSCNNWICLTCSKVSPGLYDELVKDSDANPGNNSIGWLCCVCKGMKSDLRSINTNILELKSSNDKRLQQVEDKLSSLENSIQDTVRKEVETAKTDITEVVKKDIADTVEKLVEAKIKEMEDRKNRSNNLIFFNVKTSEDPDSKE